MNKRILMAVAILATLASSSASFGATISTTTSIGSLGFSPSNKVIVTVFSSSGVIGTSTGSYCASTAHNSGSRTFATDSTQSIIWWHDGIDNAVTSGQTMTAGSGWTSM